MSLLRKGLNFAITPRTIHTKDILASVETAVSHLPREKQDAIRASKQPNLTSKERRVLRELKSDESIVII